MLGQIGHTTFFSDTLAAVDKMIGNFVQVAYQNLINSNDLLITLIITFYMMWVGYRFITHTHSAEFMSVTRHLVLVLVVWGLMMSWQLYNLFFYNIFTNEPQAITTVMVNSIGQGGDVKSVIDNVFNQVMIAAKSLLENGAWDNWLPYILAVNVFLFGGLMCGIALALFIYAKLATAIALGLGPIFVAMLLFDATKGYFNKWISKLVTFALIPIITSCVLSFMLSLVNNAMVQIEVPGDRQGFADISVFSMLNLVTIFFLVQVPGMAATLGGGFSLAGMREAIGMAKGAMGAAGGAAGLAAGAAKGVKSLSKKADAFIKRKLF